MKPLGQFLIGILTAAGSGLLVLAAISLALVEGGANRASLFPTPSATSTVITGALTPAGGVTLQPTLAQVVTATLAQENCTLPEGWVPYIVQSGDDLNSIAARYGLTVEDFRQKNCMVTDTPLIAGKYLYVPFLLTETAAPTDTPAPSRRPACGAPSGWVIYTVRSGDTLTSLAKSVGSSVPAIQQANCLTSSFIVTGTKLYLPSIPPDRNAPTATLTISPSSTVASQPTSTEQTLPTKPGPTETETATPEPTSVTPETPIVTAEIATATLAAKPETVVPPTAETPKAETTPVYTETPIPTKGVNK